MNNLIFKLEQRKLVGDSLDSNDSKTRIQNYNELLSKQLSALRDEVTASPSSITIVSQIERNINAMRKAALAGNTALYSLKEQVLIVEEELILQQRLSIQTLNALIAKLDGLSALISEQNLKEAADAITIANNTRWLMIVLALLIALSMAKFIFSISRRINAPLEELRSAMHALSSRHFDTRLNQTSHDNEFSLLAGDFNQFAENNQGLIQDLDEAKQSLQEQELHLRTILEGCQKQSLVYRTQVSLSRQTHMLHMC